MEAVLFLPVLMLRKVLVVNHEILAAFSTAAIFPF